MIADVDLVHMLVVFRCALGGCYEADVLHILSRWLFICNDVGVVGVVGVVVVVVVVGGGGGGGGGEGGGGGGGGGGGDEDSYLHASFFGTFLLSVL